MLEPGIWVHRRKSPVNVENTSPKVLSKTINGQVTQSPYNKCLGQSEKAVQVCYWNWQLPSPTPKVYIHMRYMAYIYGIWWRRWQAGSRRGVVRLKSRFEHRQSKGVDIIIISRMPQNSIGSKLILESSVCRQQLFADPVMGYAPFSPGWVAHAFTLGSHDYQRFEIQARYFVIVN